MSRQTCSNWKVWLMAQIWKPAILSCAYSYEVIAKKIVENNPSAQDHPFYGGAFCLGNAQGEHLRILLQIKVILNDVILKLRLLQSTNKRD